MESTTRRAYILQNVIRNDGAGIETSDNMETQNHHNNIPFVSVSVQIIPATTSLSDVDDDVVLEWKYDDVSVDDNDVDTDDDNNIIPISMMTHEELIQEENLLLQMANTPIPTSSMNDMKTNCTTLRDTLCQEWGESQYMQMQLKFKNDES